MPDFIAALISVSVFCLSVMVLNGLTGLAIATHLAPSDLGENGFVQYGFALILARVAWRRTTHRRVA